MTRPWCAGSGHAIPIPADESRYEPRWAQCDNCGLRLHSTTGHSIPRHRERRCLVAGCESPQTGAGVCAAHNAELVYGMEDE